MAKDEGTLSGDPETGKWTFKYKGKLHKYPRTKKSTTGKVPKEVVDWAAGILAKDIIAKL